MWLQRSLDVANDRSESQQRQNELRRFSDLDRGVVHYAVVMKLPADAGTVLVDLRPRMRLRELVITAAFLVVVGLLPAGDPNLWPLSAFVGAIAVVTVVLIAVVRMSARRVIAVCVQGLAVQRGRTATLVLWAQIRRIHSRWLALRGSRAQQIVVETDAGPARFGFVPGQARSREQDELTARAVAAIQQHTRLELKR